MICWPTLVPINGGRGQSYTTKSKIAQRRPHWLEQHAFSLLCLKGSSQQLQENKARPSLRSERKLRGDLEKRHPEGLI